MDIVPKNIYDICESIAISSRPRKGNEPKTNSQTKSATLTLKMGVNDLIRKLSETVSAKSTL